MPYTEKQNQNPLFKASRELSLITTKRKVEWKPKTAQLKGSQQMGFQKLSDKLSGGLQYWYKHKHSGHLKHYNEYLKNNRQMGERLLRGGRCGDCGGFANEESKFLSYLDPKYNEPKCGFGRQYCDVIGPCADCALLQERNNILDKQDIEFPDIEVTPRRLVAPLLAEEMYKSAKPNPPSIDEYNPSNSFFRLPNISPETLRYMRRATGSPSQRKQQVPSDNTDKKQYIEVRLPKI